MESTCAKRNWAVPPVDGEVTRQHIFGLYLQVQRSLAKGRVNVLLDMRGATYLDSSALGILVRAYKDAKIHGGELALAHVPRDIQAVLEYTRLDSIFRQTRVQIPPDDPDPLGAA